MFECALSIKVKYLTNTKSFKCAKPGLFLFLSSFSQHNDEMEET